MTEFSNLHSQLELVEAKILHIFTKVNTCPSRPTSTGVALEELITGRDPKKTIGFLLNLPRKNETIRHLFLPAKTATADDLTASTVLGFWRDSQNQPRGRPQAAIIETKIDDKTRKIEIIDPKEEDLSVALVRLTLLENYLKEEG
jgi:hypothetical protein